jgi:hypothetical protein
MEHETIDVDETFRRQHEAAMLREAARQIRRHLSLYGSVLGCGSRDVWADIALSKERLAAALDMPPIAAREVA